MLGDWFNTIALYTLVERLTGSPLALGGIFITKMLSFALASPIAGLLADRFDRRRLMIACDLLRAVVVLGFLFIEEAGDVPLLYTLVAAQLAIGAAFLPARNAAIPNITTPRELVTANTLMAATWSALLAIGAAIGGVAAEWLGLRTVFLIDSATYLVSAYFLVRVTIPRGERDQEPSPSAGRPRPSPTASHPPVGRGRHLPARVDGKVDDTEDGWGRPSPREGEEGGSGRGDGGEGSQSVLRQAMSGILDGWRYIFAHPPIARMALVKTAWSTGGSGLVFMLALLGQKLMPAAESIGMGLLFAARGLGTGVGPLAARAWVPAKEKWPLMFGFGILFSGAVYVAVGSVPWTYWLVPLVFLAHTTSGANWTFSTVLLQDRTPDEYRGRVFSSEWLLLTLVDAVAIFIASLILEEGILTLRFAVIAFASVQLVCGALWLMLAVPRERDWQRHQRSSADPTASP